MARSSASEVSDRGAEATSILKHHGMFADLDNPEVLEDKTHASSRGEPEVRRVRTCVFFGRGRRREAGRLCQRRPGRAIRRNSGHLPLRSSGEILWRNAAIQHSAARLDKVMLHCDAGGLCVLHANRADNLVMFGDDEFTSAD